MNARRYSAIAMLLAVTVAATWLSAPGATSSGSELVDYGKIEGRSYHDEAYERGRCNQCHVGSRTDAQGYPPDDSCDRCHERDELVEATLRENEEDGWQNPHDNLHYGTLVPCVECHGEHSRKAPLCANCHNFDYPKHDY